MGDFRDVELRVVRRAPGDDNDNSATYVLEMTVGGEQEVGGVTALAELLPWLDAGDPAADGRRLFDALFADEATRRTWDEVRGRFPYRRLRLRLDAAAPALHVLPWELLDDGEGVLAARAETPFSRYLPSPVAWGQAVEARPIRVLAVIANPVDLVDYNLTPLDVDAEVDVLRSAVAVAGEGKVHLDFLDAPVTLKRLEEALRRGYHALHFVGHGFFNRRRQEAVLYFQGQDGQVQVVRDVELVAMLKRQRSRLRLVFLAACQSATRSTVHAFLGLGPRLVVVGLPAVVAMQGTISVAAAREMSAAFYASLVRQSERGGAVVDVAMNEARSVLLTQGRPDVAVPILFMRLRSGLLWGDEASSPSPEIALDQSGQQVYGPQANVVGGGDFVSGDKIVYQLDVGRLVDLLREALPEGDPAPAQFREMMEQFGSLHAQLYEWKELHNAINEIAYVMDQFTREVERLDAQGLSGDPRQLRRLWRPVANKVQIVLEWAAEDVEHITQERFIRTSDGVRGPRWAVELYRAREQVNALLRPEAYDLAALYDATYDFMDVVDRHLYLVDRHLRETAGKLYDLSRLVLRG